MKTYFILKHIDKQSNFPIEHYLDEVEENAVLLFDNRKSALSYKRTYYPYRQDKIIVPVKLKE